MNHAMRIWKTRQTVWPVFLDSSRVRVDSWCQWTTGRSSNALESFLGLELSSNYEISFKLFVEKLQFGYGSLAAFSCPLDRVFLCIYMWSILGQKQAHESIEFMIWRSDLKIWFSIMYFQSFFIENPCQSWKIFPFLNVKRPATLP